MKKIRIFTVAISLFFMVSSADAKRIVQIQTATTVALSWSVGPGSEFDCKRIALKFNTAPTTAGNITVTLDSHQGATYDTVLRTADPVGSTSVVFEDINGQVYGDKLLISYANTDLRSITGTAVCEI